MLYEKEQVDTETIKYQSNVHVSRKHAFRKSNLADSSQSALHFALCRHACIKVQLEGSAVNTAAEYLYRRTCRLCVFLLRPSQTRLTAVHVQPSATTLDDSARRWKSSLFSWWQRTGLKLSYSSSFSRQKKKKNTSQPPALYLNGPQTAGGVGVWWIFITACLPAGLSAVTHPDQKGYGAAVWRLWESA